MLAERITVTTTPTAISALIETARSADAGSLQTKAKAVKLKYASTETVTVAVSDADTANAVTILDAPNGLYAASMEHFDISQILLTASSGTVVVDVIVEQPRA